jgi:hypothetical protein
MGPDHRAINVMDGPIELADRIDLLFDGVTHPRPDTGPLPAIEATRDRTPGAIALWQITPGRPSTHNPEDAIQHCTMIMGRPTDLRFLRREQRFEPLPWCIGQISSVHAL